MRSDTALKEQALIALIERERSSRKEQVEKIERKIQIAHILRAIEKRDERTARLEDKLAAEIEKNKMRQEIRDLRNALAVMMRGQQGEGLVLPFTNTISSSIDSYSGIEGQGNNSE